MDLIMIVLKIFVDQLVYDYVIPIYDDIGIWYQINILYEYEFDTKLIFYMGIKNLISHSQDTNI